MYPEQKTYNKYNTNAPCRTCNQRQVGCHGNCEKYATYKRDIKRLNEKNKDYGIY
jgi:hypothetical protein